MNSHNYRHGIGYDSHRFPNKTERQRLLSDEVWEESTEYMALEKGITIGGVKASKKYTDRYLCFVSRSDGDVLYHAVVNSILSALGHSKYRDIGTVFPNDSSINSNRNSEDFIKFVYNLIVEKGYTVEEIKVTLKGKVRVDLDHVEKNLMKLLNMDDPDCVLVQGTSGENMDGPGMGLGMECTALCVIKKA